MAAPCAHGPSDASRAGHATPACLRELSRLLVRAKDTDVSVLASLKDKQQGILGAFCLSHKGPAVYRGDENHTGAGRIGERGGHEYGDSSSGTPERTLILVLAACLRTLSLLQVSRTNRLFF